MVDFKTNVANLGRLLTVAVFYAATILSFFSENAFFLKVHSSNVGFLARKK